MRRTLLFLATTALLVLVACAAALAASVNCPNASGGYCYGTPRGDALYGTPDVDRMYGYGGSDLMNGYGGSDFMYGGNESGLGDKMRGGTGADLVNGQGGDDLIEGGPGSDTLKTGKGSDRVEAQDGTKDFIFCRGSNDAVYYDRGLDVLEGCPNAITELPPTGSPFEPGTKVLVEHEGKELCLPEKALNGHLRHGDEVLGWSGCAEQQQ
jgi:RTX calcium-binding nonapeptide repeat (4 copies)